MFELNYLLAKTKVKDILPAAQELITISPDDYIEIAAKLMLTHRISALPVLEKGVLAGIITETDLFSALVDLMGVKHAHTRIDILLPEGPGSLAEITGTIAARGINIINAALYFQEKLNKYKVVLRIEELNYEPVVKAVQDKGYEIESVIVSS